MKHGERFVDFVVDHPWKTLLIGLALFMACAPGGAHIAPDFSYRVWFNDDDPLIVEFDTFERRFGNDDRAIIIVHSPSGVFDEESAQLLIDLTQAMWRAPDVIRVDSLANFNWVHAEEDELIVEPLIPDDLELTAELLAERKKAALSHETLPDYMVSRDGTVAMLYATIRPALGGSPEYKKFLVGGENERGETLKGAREIIKDFTRGDHVLYMTGGPSINVSFEEAAQYDIQNILPWVFGLTLLFLGILFRRITGVLLPVVVIVLTIGATMGVGGWFGFSINNMTSSVPQVMVAICIADSVHVLVSYFRAMARGANRITAARHSLKKNFLPTVLTSISTAIGFFSFSQANVVPIGQLGTMAGIGTLLAWCFTYLALGPLMVKLPIKGGTMDETQLDLHAASPFAMRQAERLLGVRRVVIGAFAVLGAVTIALASQTQVNSNPFEYFPDDSPMNLATDFMDEKVGGPTTMEIVIDSGEEDGFKDPAFMQKLGAFQDWLEAQPYVTSNTSLVDVLKSMNKSLHADDPKQYVLPDTREGIAQQHLLYTMSLPQGMDLNDRVSVKNDALRLTSSWNIRDSAVVVPTIDLVEAKAKEMGLDAQITGKVQLWQRMNPYVVSTFVKSISIAVVLMSILMIVVFRSFGLGMLAMLPNMFPLLLGAALVHAIGHYLDMGTVIAFSFCLGIAVDDTVHFMANYARLRHEGMNAKDAVASIFTHTVPALTTTTIVLVIAFGAFMFATFLPNRNFGIFVATILTMALFTDVTLLPALLMSKKGDGSEQPELLGDEGAGAPA